jgi:NAD(P)-dependent dehydrogenase (short-subunit alcohol dehydrogenase family)
MLTSLTIKKFTENKIKFAIITGGSGRIGSVFTKLLINSGTKVLCLSRDEKKFEHFKKKLGKKKKLVSWAYLDLADKNSIEKIVTSIKKKYKKIDLLVNNAFFSNRGENFNYESFSLSKELFGSIGGTILFTECLIKILRNTKNSKVINIGSIWGSLAPKQSIYGKLQIGPSAISGVGKSGIINYTKFLAVREAKYNLTVNSLSPEWFPRKGKVKNLKYIKQIKHNVPLNRIGKLEDLISPIIFLLSSGSSYYTGQNLVIDGGYSIW